MINTVISTVFALSIVLSQVLINVNPSFWYLDPVLSIVLAIFMMGFGIKVIHQNFNILKQIYCGGSQPGDKAKHNPHEQGLILIERGKKTTGNLIIGSSQERPNQSYGSYMTIEGEHAQPFVRTKSDYSSIVFQ